MFNKWKKRAYEEHDKLTGALLELDATQKKLAQLITFSDRSPILGQIINLKYNDDVKNKKSTKLEINMNMYSQLKYELAPWTVTSTVDCPSTILGFEIIITNNDMRLV